MASFLDRIFPSARQRVTTDMDRFRRIFMGEYGGEIAGVDVTLRKAMGIAAFYACVRNISEDCAKMPIRLAKTRPDGGSDAITNHPVLPVLNRQPNPSMTAMSFREALFSQALTCEGAFAEIVRDGAGRVTQLWPLDSSRMGIRQNDDTGVIDYEYRMDSGQAYPLRPRDVFHIHGVGNSGVAAWVNTEIGKIVFGKILSVNKHAAGFFGNNAILSGVLEAPPTLSAKAIENLRTSFTLRHGGAENAYKWAILTDGVQAKPIAVDPEKSQLVEAIYQGVEEVCRFYRMPPNKVQHLQRSTYSNISEENQSYATDTLQPWAERFSQEIQVKLLGASEQNVEAYFDDRMFLESDPVKRTDVQMKQFQMGLYSIDELRIEAGLKPIGGEVGGARWIMAQVQSAEKALAPEVNTAPAAAEATAEPEPEPEPKESEPEPTDKAAIVEAFRGVFAGHFGRMIRASENRALTASKHGRLPQFQADYSKNAIEFVGEGTREAVIGFAKALGGDLNGSLDSVLNRIAVEYIDKSGARLVALCAEESTIDYAKWAERMADYAIRACREGLNRGS